MFLTDIALITLFLLCIVDAVTLYEIRCPVRSEQRLLSKQCQNPIQFHCLLSAADGVYKSECRNREWVVKGNYPVRRGFRQYVDYEPCPIDIYQPFVFWSNEDHQCNMVKSLCSEEGQVQYDNGTTTSDKSCNCDTASGYEFAVPPKNKLYCVSSEEDCSCLQKSCIDIHRQNADTNCARREMIETDTGSLTGQKKKDIKEEYNSTKQISRFRNTMHTKSEGRLLFGIAVFLIILTILFGLMVIISVAFCRLELVCQEQHEKHDIFLSKIDPVRRGKQLILSDIIILHTDDDFFKVRAIYKGHLTFIARQFGYNDVTIESFKDAFPSTEKIPLQEVIKHCRFLFFYVSGMSFPSKVATYGLNEKEINSVLNLPQKYIKYPSIKIVCACEHSSCNFSEIDLDYFNYKTDKTIRESYKETLKLILKSIKKSY